MSATRNPASGPTIDAALPALRDLARAHHEAGGLRYTRCICACGFRSGGPAGTPACEELRRVQAALDAVERPAGCVCQWEAGDSPCPVHGDEEG